MTSFVEFFDDLNQVVEDAKGAWRRRKSDDDTLCFVPSVEIPPFGGYAALEETYCHALKLQHPISLMKCLRQRDRLANEDYWSRENFSLKTYAANLAIDLERFFLLPDTLWDKKQRQAVEEEIQFREKTLKTRCLSDLMMALDAFISRHGDSQPDHAQRFLWYNVGLEALGCTLARLDHVQWKHKQEHQLLRDVCQAEVDAFLCVVRCLAVYDTRLLDLRLRKPVPLPLFYSCSPPLPFGTVTGSLKSVCPRRCAKIFEGITSQQKKEQEQQTSYISGSSLKAPSLASCDKLVEVFRESSLDQDALNYKEDTPRVLEQLYQLCRRFQHEPHPLLELMTAALNILFYPHEGDIHHDIQELIDLFGVEHLDLLEMFLTHRQECQKEIEQKIRVLLPELGTSNHRTDGTLYGGSKRCDSRDSSGKTGVMLNDEDPVNAFIQHKTLYGVLELLGACCMHDSNERHARHYGVGYGNAKEKACETPETGPDEMATCWSLKSYDMRGEKKFVLPMGAEHVKKPGIETVIFPWSEPRKMEGEGLISVEALPHFAKSVFQDIQHFNLVQSRVLPCALGSDDNFLVSAPTSCGKTHIGLLAVLRAAMEKNTDMSYDWVIPSPETFKVVYIAPMRSLVYEICRKYTQALKPLQLKVIEMTSETHITREQLMSAHVLVTTPEKWDILTRQVCSSGISTASHTLMASVKCLIFDEVHLLNDDRGPILESIVARTFRHMEASQLPIRLVGLSATLPNWRDIGEFLGATPQTIFHFDESFRPIPLQKILIGVNPSALGTDMNSLLNQLCYDHVVKELSQEGQVLVFVHSRDDTWRTAQALHHLATLSSSLHKRDAAYFQIQTSPKFVLVQQKLASIQDPALAQSVFNSIGFHHAGMSRSDRHLMEYLFSQGILRVLVSTSTLAWGVNLPARRVIIKGTHYFNSKTSTDTPIHILDVLQMFGRAGRPQYDTQGTAVLLTPSGTFQWYLRLLTNQVSIESKLLDYLPNAFNAEISMGNITNEQEALRWLSSTYLSIRLFKSPLAYGVKWSQYASDVSLGEFRRYLVTKVTHYLEEIHMIRLMGRSPTYYPTELGRTATRYYVDCGTAVNFDTLLRNSTMELSDTCILNALANAQEFRHMKTRPEELDELRQLAAQSEWSTRSSLDTAVEKVVLLVEVYLKRIPLASFSLVSDIHYIRQNMPRLGRALLTFSLSKSIKQPGLSSHRILEWCKMLERCLWFKHHVLRHFCYRDVFTATPAPVDSTLSKTTHVGLKESTAMSLEQRGFHLHSLIEMTQGELFDIVRQRPQAYFLFQCLKWIPNILIHCRVKPLTSRVAKVFLTLTPSFSWHPLYNGAMEPFRIWVECPETQVLLYTTEWNLLFKNRLCEKSMEFMIPLGKHAKDSSQYFIHVISDKWVGITFQQEFSVKQLAQNHLTPLITPLLNLHPLPIECLNNINYQQLYSFKYFNPIQTQLFHVLYHTDENVLLGAPTGSGKTMAAELAIFRLLNTLKNPVMVYVAPLKALAKERVDDWTNKFQTTLGRRVTELTGDRSPDLEALRSSTVIVTTPEKFDGVTRLWRQRAYIRRIRLVIFDEIHLLGLSRGPILEMIVTRLRYMSDATQQPIRFIGLSTALSNAQDIADWLGVKYNQGFFEKHYCPRMASMNQPAYAAIKNFSAQKPVLIFVSSRRQTRITALDLIALALLEQDMQQAFFFQHLDRTYVEEVLPLVQNTTLKYTLEFGIGIHHAGLQLNDRLISERLFRENKIPVLITTSTLAWGVNLPAHLVIIKGTEIFDSEKKTYVDMPLTDILQMMGRAGRPQYDKEAVVFLFVMESKKEFYKSFIYEPFPVESSLHLCLEDHLNAEIANGTIGSGVDVLNFLTWTYFFRRLKIHPDYYMSKDEEGRKSTDRENPSSLEGVHEPSRKDRLCLAEFVESLLLNVLERLQKHQCIKVHSRDFHQDILAHVYSSTALGALASRFYVSTQTAYQFQKAIQQQPCMTWIGLLVEVSQAVEYAQLPVRHNEEKSNEELAQQCPLQVTAGYDSPHTKALLLFQAHLFSRTLPIPDYLTDLKSVLDQSVRLIQCLIHVAIDLKQTKCLIHALLLAQSVAQGIAPGANPLSVLAPFRDDAKLSQNPQHTLPHLIERSPAEQMDFLQRFATNVHQAYTCLRRYPRLRVSLRVNDSCTAESVRLIEQGNRRTVVMGSASGKNQPKSFSLHLCVALWYVTPPECKIYSAALGKYVEYKWWILVVDEENRLWFCQAVNPMGSDISKTTNVPFVLKDLKEDYLHNFRWKVLIISDTFVGIDQEMDFCVERKVDT